MNQIELLAPCPFLKNIVDFENAIGGHPINGWRVEIDAANLGWVGLA